MHCSAERIEEYIEKIAEFTEAGEGFTRFSYTTEDLAAKEYLVEVMKKLNLNVTMDQVGNLKGRRAGLDNNLPVIMIGSHLDSVKNGGKYDGVAGIAAALEIIKVLEENNITTKHPIEIIAFSEEEGGRFKSSLVGSRWIAGKLEPSHFQELKDEGGVTLGEALNALKNIDVKGEERKLQDIKAFYELHCEQGPVLENEKKDLGIVKCITGSSIYEVNLKGKADHAGTTPMDMRNDALYAVSKIHIELNQYLKKYAGEAVGTIGYLQVLPGAPNIIPGEAIFTMDIRSPQKEIMDDIISYMKEYIEKVCKRDAFDYQIEQKLYAVPVNLSENARLEKYTDKRGYSHRKMVSGAGHDAMIMAQYTDVGMVFVPSSGGRSHCPEEAADVKDIARGADVILDAVLGSDPFWDN